MASCPWHDRSRVEHRAAIVYSRLERASIASGVRVRSKRPPEQRVDQSLRRSRPLTVSKLPTEMMIDPPSGSTSALPPRRTAGGVVVGPDEQPALRIGRIGSKVTSTAFSAARFSSAACACGLFGLIAIPSDLVWPSARVT